MSSQIPFCRMPSRRLLRLSESSKKMVHDFLLTAQVEMALAKEGHMVSVQVNDGDVTLTINKHVLMLSRLENEVEDNCSESIWYPKCDDDGRT